MRRRALAITAIAALIIVPSVLLFLSQRNNGDGDQAAIPKTPHTAKDTKQGIEVSWPDGWALTRKHGALRLISTDKTSAILVSSPAPAKQALGLFASSVAGVSGSYRKKKIRYLKGRILVSGLPSETALISGKTKKGVKQNVVLTVVRGHKRAYVIEAIVPANGGRPGDVAVISRSIKLTH